MVRGAITRQVLPLKTIGSDLLVLLPTFKVFVLIEQRARST